VAKVFATLRVTGHVSDGVARDLLAQLRSFTDACDAVGVEVKQSVDVTGLEPEPAFTAGGFVTPAALSGGNDGGPESVIPLADLKIPSPDEIEKAWLSKKVVFPKHGKGAK
jgi:hypothetical protein